MIPFTSNNGQETIRDLETNPPGKTPEIFAPGFVSVKHRFDYGISCSPDFKEFAFGILDIKDESGQIYYSKKIDNKWIAPENADFLGNSSIFLPSYTPDGKSLLYTQTQQDSATYITDIWMVNRLDNGWGKPTRLPEPINSGTRESSVCMTLNKTIYFSSGRNCPGVAYCPATIYCAKSDSEKYRKVDRVIQLNVKGDNESIFVSADESFALLSNVAPKENNSDLYISFRNQDNVWSQPVRLDSSINTKDWELRPFVSANNKYLFFTRMTFDKTGPVESDIYWVDIERLLKPIKTK
jgi:hypothetical protein